MGAGAARRASTVVAHASFLTEAIREHADVVFPAEVYAEKEGTIVHPDGRLQRLRPAIARAGEVRAEWHVLARARAAARASTSTCSSGAMASRQLFDAVPFYAGLTLEEIGGRGVRWQEREAAGAFPAGDPRPRSPAARRRCAPRRRGRRASSPGYRSVWDAPEVELLPGAASSCYAAAEELRLSG